MKRKLALIIALILVLALFAGCGSNNKTADNSGGTKDNGSNSSASSGSDTTATPTATAPAETESPYNYAVGKYKADANGLALEKYEYELPLTTTDEEFTFWTSNLTPQYLPEDGYGASPLPVADLKATGVHIAYDVVAMATRAENFSVLLAADNLDDVMCAASAFYKGSFKDAVVTEQYFANIYDYREYMPNYIYEATRDPNDKSTIKTVFNESNLILAIYELKKEGALTDGPFVRGDWLDKMGKKNTDIVTFQDLHDMLVYFKSNFTPYPTSIFKTLEVVGCNEWVAYDTYCFVNGSGLPQTLVKNGKVSLANMNDSDKQLMTMLNQWFSEGLFDPNWSSYAGVADIDKKIKASEVGYIIGGGTSIAAHNSVIPADAKVGWMPLTKPVLTKGQTLHLGYDLPRVYWGSAAISTKCENIPLVCTWIDWRYSEAGSFLYGYGEEGVTYEYDQNGDLWIKDEIVNHPAYWGMIMCTYALNHIVEPGLKIDFSVNLKINKDVPGYLKYWMSTPHDSAYVFPRAVTYTSEQTADLAKYGADIATYIQENYLAFVDGSKSLSEWDSYVKGLNDIGIQNVIAIYQDAYDRFVKS